MVITAVILTMTHLGTTCYAHSEHKKEKEDTVITEVVQKVQKTVSDSGHTHVQGEEKEHSHSAHSHATEKIKADFDDFPTLHPLVVHFPIVLLLLAAFSQMASLFVFKNELSWVTMLLVTGGFIGAYVAGNNVHPHTVELEGMAAKILTEHENYANYTVWLSGIAALLKIVSHFFLKRKLWSEILVTALLIGSTYCVSTAGHLGAQLIHIEGIGAKGNFLESKGHEHDHKH